MVKISSVRCVTSRRSRSEIGMERVALEPRLIDEDAVSLERRSLLSMINAKNRYVNNNIPARECTAMV